MRSHEELVRKTLEVQEQVRKVCCTMPARNEEEVIKRVRALAILEGQLTLLEWFLIREELRKVDA